MIIFWLVFNTLIALALRHWGYLDEPELMLWSIFYFFFDVFSVVVWCPLQIFMMRNRCCTTCQIFNWDGIMAATPLFLLGWHPQLDRHRAGARGAAAPGDRGRAASGALR